MVIERLKKEDINKYKELIDEVFNGSNNLDEYQKYNESSDNYYIVVAKQDDKIIGSITMYMIDLFTNSLQPAIELFNVAVSSKYRGLGISKKLFEYVINYAKDNNYKMIYLTCFGDACIAHKLYENMGFKRTSSVKFELHL
jgi:predicted N-acetyltransferase YhbS